MEGTVLTVGQYLHDVTLFKIVDCLKLTVSRYYKCSLLTLSENVQATLEFLNRLGK
jgi:hypothetical protein